MTNTPDPSAYSWHGAPNGTYGRYPSTANAGNERVNRLSRPLWTVVAVLGPVVFAVDLSSPVSLGFSERLGVLTSIVVAVGLLPRQSVRGWIVVALAVTGFSEALASWLRNGESAWALTTIMVLNALQALAAVGALLGETAVKSNSGHDYSAYVRLAQAYQEYAMHYHQPSAPQYDAAGQTTTQAQGEAAARARGVSDLAEQESFVALQAKYAQYGVSASAPHSHGSGGPPPPVPVAGTSVNRSVPEPYTYGGPEKSGESIIGPSGP